MEHPPRAYTTVQQALDDMDRTIMGEVLREVLQHETASFPLEIICVARTGVQLILALDTMEGSVTPVIVRAWDWIPPGPMGRPGTVRGTLQIWAVNAQGDVIYPAVYPPERLEVE
jgi:hypothetical protein